MPIADHLLRQLSGEAHLNDIAFSPAAAAALQQYGWPGNVRELSNVLERILSSLEGGCIRIQDLPFYLHPRENSGQVGQAAPIRIVQEHAEKEAIVIALQGSGDNKAQAARLLGIHRTLLYKKIKKYGL